MNTEESIALKYTHTLSHTRTHSHIKHIHTSSILVHKTYFSQKMLAYIFFNTNSHIHTCENFCVFCTSEGGSRRRRRRSRFWVHFLFCGSFSLLSLCKEGVRGHLFSQNCQTAIPHTHAPLSLFFTFHLTSVSTPLPPCPSLASASSALHIPRLTSSVFQPLAFFPNL